MAWHEAGKIVDWKIGQGRELLFHILDSHDFWQRF